MTAQRGEPPHRPCMGSVNEAGWQMSRVELDALLRESFGVRRGPVNHAHGVAPLLQRSDEVLSKEARASSDEYFQLALPLARRPGTRKVPSSPYGRGTTQRRHSPAAAVPAARSPAHVAPCRWRTGCPRRRATRRSAHARHARFASPGRGVLQRSAVQEPVGNVNAWHPRAQLVGDLSQELTCVGHLSSVML